MAGKLEEAGIIIHEVRVLVAVRSGSDPADWDWDELVGDPPLYDKDAGTRVLGARSDQIDEATLTTHELEVIYKAADLSEEGATS